MIVWRVSRSPCSKRFRHVTRTDLRLKNMNRLIGMRWTAILIVPLLAQSSGTFACSAEYDAQSWGELIKYEPIVFVGTVTAIREADGTISERSPDCDHQFDLYGQKGLEDCMEQKVGRSAIFRVEVPIRGAMGSMFEVLQESRPNGPPGGCPAFERHFFLGERWLFAGKDEFEASVDLGRLNAEQVSVLVARAKALLATAPSINASSTGSTFITASPPSDAIRPISP